MTNPFRKAMLAATGSVMVLALSACGPDDLSSTRNALALSDALGPYNYTLDDRFGFADEPYFDEGGYDYYPESLPMLASRPASYDYSPAPYWDYADGGYADYGPRDSWGYHDEPYYDDYYDEGYYDESYYYDEPRSQDYTWLALAALIGGVLGNSPPDYAYYYDGVQPWAWNTGNGYYRYAEPVRGGYRYYYYEPRAARPFLVRDPYYSYGYRADRLVVIYDRDGRILRPERAHRQRHAASSYYDRGYRLHRAAKDGRRFGVAAPQWADRRTTIVADQRHWARAREERREWRDWSREREPDVARNWRDEREARQIASRRFDQWQQASYSGPAPVLYREAQARKRASVARAEARGDRRDNVAEFRRAALVREGQDNRQQLERFNSRRIEDRAENRLAAVSAQRRAAIRDQREERDSKPQRGSARQERAEQQRVQRQATQRAERPVQRQATQRAEQQRVQRQATQRAERPVQRQASQRAEQQRVQRQASQRAEQQRVLRQASQRAEQQRVQRQASQRAEQQRVQRQASERAEQQRVQRQASQRAEQQRVQRQASERAEQQRVQRLASQRAEQQRVQRQASQRAEQQRVQRQASQRAEQQRVQRETSQRAERQAPQVRQAAQQRREQADQRRAERGRPDGERGNRRASS